MPVVADLDQVEAALDRGEVVGLPTDTVYGLACLAARASACEQIFVHKGRPADLALPVLVADLGQAIPLVDAPHDAFRSLAALWPGPLTIVVRRSGGLDWHLGGDEQSLGVRCPDHEVVRGLARRLGPLAVTSANPHRLSPAHSAQECADFFDHLLVYDGGACDGEPSTVVSLLEGEPKILRPGPVDEQAIGRALVR